MKTETRNLAWRINWYRQSELEGALLLGRLVTSIDDPFLIEKLTEHAADEARHSQMWEHALRTAELPAVRIFRSYQSFYLDHDGLPTSLVETLAFTQIFEQRVHRTFHEEQKSPGLPPAIRDAYARMIEDEKDHLSWVADWLAQQPEADAALRRYRQIDQQVFREIEPFRHCLFNLTNLGQELNQAQPNHDS